ncbi:cysteine-rich receptor-like protein kinase 6 [Triticum aestivum]|uniref:cysteine-rich receptor-like protein kinase 6 n=1 Tax=Triticum aestivum TaxID=4565 RepID=UPI001D00CE6A|nr:cysteine-rich receptor-like protein kinase 6 [Triticum aestivum]
MAAVLAYESHVEGIDSTESLIIDLPTIRIATDNFAEDHKLGEGGFGAVYKGSLPDGQDIAVKRLSRFSQQGIGELKNELVLISNLQHKNLVRLIGVCLQEDEKLLVYEYMPNKSLDTFLFDSEKRKELHWGRRLMIIDGIARGLQYLHEDSLLKIVHRDLKASNILLDANMNPKISDFGLAKLFGGDQSQDITNRVVGTYGYMAPEYALRGRYSIKSDIYSFGVLILEILTGRKNSDTYNSDQLIDLPSLVWEYWTMKSIMEMIDPYLRGDSSQEEILRCVHIGLSCVQEDPAERPTIWTINVMLDSNTIPSHPPSKPAFYVEMGANFVSEGINDSTPKSNAASLNELSITDPEPR